MHAKEVFCDLVHHLGPEPEYPARPTGIQQTLDNANAYRERELRALAGSAHSALMHDLQAAVRLAATTAQDAQTSIAERLAQAGVGDGEAEGGDASCPLALTHDSLLAAVEMLADHAGTVESLKAELLALGARARDLVELEVIHLEESSSRIVHSDCCTVAMHACLHSAKVGGVIACSPRGACQQGW